MDEERPGLLIMYHFICCTFVNCYENHNNYEPILAALNITSSSEKARMLLTCHRIMTGDDLSARQSAICCLELLLKFPYVFLLTTSKMSFLSTI